MFRMIWKSIPVFRAVIPLISGILVAIQFHIRFALNPALILTLLALLALFSQLPSTIQFRFRAINGILIFILFFLLGILVTTSKTDNYKSDYFGHHLLTGDKVIATIIKEPIEKERSIKVSVRIEAIKRNDTLIQVTGKSLVYLEKSDQSGILKYGDRLILKQAFREIDDPKNPNEFGYKRYLSFHNIFHQAYFRDGDYSLTDSNKASRFFKTIYKIRGNFLSVINRYIKDNKSRGVASALLLGYRDLLDESTIKDYSSTGAMHVLAVSGLHVGIVYLVLNGLLAWMKRKKILLQYLKPFLLLSGIWFYATITGLSPSVTRAATMFSFVVFGSLFRRHFNIYSSILSSAFFLLLINPYYITEIGFLLSYAAVIGIVYIQPKIYRKLYFKNWLLDKIWAITCVSLAAQVATFPLGLLYFHQFPVYFLFSNLVVIPAAILILYGGLMLFVFSFLPVVAQAIGFVLDHAIQFLNFLIGLIEQLPYALISGIHVTKPEVYLLYGFIIFIAFWLVHRRKPFIFISLGLVLLLSISFSFRYVNHSNQKQLIVYHVPNHTAIDLASGKTCMFISDTTLLQDSDKMLFHINHNRWKLGLRTIDFKEIIPNSTDKSSTSASQSRLITFNVGKRKGVIVNSNCLAESTFDTCHWLVVTNLNPSDLPLLKEKSQFDVLIIDTSTKSYLADNISSACDSMNIPYYNVWQKGAYIEHIP